MFKEVLSPSSCKQHPTKPQTCSRRHQNAHILLAVIKISPTLARQQEAPILVYDLEVGCACRQRHISHPLPKEVQLHQSLAPIPIDNLELWFLGLLSRRWLLVHLGFLLLIRLTFHHQGCLLLAKSLGSCRLASLHVGDKISFEDCSLLHDPSFPRMLHSIRHDNLAITFDLGESAHPFLGQLSHIFGFDKVITSQRVAKASPLLPQLCDDLIPLPPQTCQEL